MEELFELRSCIEDGRYADALVLIGEMEEMSRDDKINKIESFLEILIIHLIKQHAEKRSTRSWDTSIFNSVYQVNKVNRRRKSGGYYLTEHEIEDAIKESYTVALKHASLEVFEGMYSDSQLSDMIDSSSIMEEALELVLKGRHQSR